MHSHFRLLLDEGQALANDWVHDPDALIIDVDCTAGKKASSFCNKKRVDDFPALKYGDPNSLLDYQGPRSYPILAEFAKEFLKPCTPSQLTACTAEQKQLLSQYQTLTPTKLQELLQEENQKVKQLKQDFENKLDKLQKGYQQMSETKAQRIMEIENGDLLYMLQIQKAREKGITGPVNDVNSSDKEEL
jgi:hypothetical protein